MSRRDRAEEGGRPPASCGRPVYPRAGEWFATPDSTDDDWDAQSVTRNVSKKVFAGFQKECGAASAELRARSERSGYVIV
jgi:hypothetical protein